jgi:hypothetical protein
MDSQISASALARVRSTFDYQIRQLTFSLFLGLFLSLFLRLLDDWLVVHEQDAVQTQFGVDGADTGVAA